MNGAMKNICVAPDTLPPMYEAFVASVERAGGTLSTIAEAEALVWADPARSDLFPATMAAAHDLAWVQLPYAGVDGFLPHIVAGPTWTCGKGVYARPVAEHILTLALAGFRDLHTFVPATSWGERTGRNLLGATITILGGGGITTEFLRLIQPFDCTINVVRRQATPIDGADRTLTQAELSDVLPSTDVLVIAWALTPETERAVNADVFDALPEHAWVVNVGRGGHIDHDDLVVALRDGHIGGAGLDVTTPEPLPSDHPLWRLPNCIITPHVGNTAAMGLPLIAARVEENVRRFLADEPLIGTIDVNAGY